MRPNGLWWNHRHRKSENGQHRRREPLTDRPKSGQRRFAGGQRSSGGGQRRFGGGQRSLGEGQRRFRGGQGRFKGGRRRFRGGLKGGQRRLKGGQRRFRVYVLSGIIARSIEITCTTLKIKICNLTNFCKF